MGFGLKTLTTNLLLLITIQIKIILIAKIFK